MLYELAGVAGLFVLAAGIAFLLVRQGRKTEESDQMKRVLDDIHTANTVRDRLSRDASAARRVRERFTR